MAFVEKCMEKCMILPRKCMEKCMEKCYNHIRFLQNLCYAYWWNLMDYKCLASYSICDNQYESVDKK